MGKGHISEGGTSLTEKDMQKIAKGWGMSLEQTKRNIADLIEQTLTKK